MEIQEMKPFTVCAVLVMSDRALEEMIVQGVDTNIDLHYMILQSEAFAKGDFDTSFIEKNLEKLVK